MVQGLFLVWLAGCVQTAAVLPSLAPTAADRRTPAYRACVAAIAAQTGNRASDIRVFDYRFSEAGTQLKATVPGAEASWSCLSANDGTVEEVMFTGSEGFL